jgi:hypothetical protein
MKPLNTILFVAIGLLIIYILSIKMCSMKNNFAFLGSIYNPSEGAYPSELNDDCMWTQAAQCVLSNGMAGTCVSNGRCMPQMEGLEMHTMEPGCSMPTSAQNCHLYCDCKEKYYGEDRSKCMHECNDNFHPYLRVKLD